jgi:hypothetical protein
MKKGTIFLFSLMILLVSCNKSTDIDLLHDGRPRILSIVIPGIAPKDVIIDQKNVTISIRLPEKLSDDITPEVTLSPNTRMVKERWWYDTILLGEENVLAVRSTDLLQSQHETIYKIILIPFAELNFSGIDPTDTMVANYGRQTWLQLPASNVYGTDLPEKLILTNVKTGEKYIFDDNLRGTNPSYFYRGWDETTNHLGVVIYNGKHPVTDNYELEFTFPKGRIVKYPRVVHLKTDKFSLSEWPMVEGAVYKPGETMSVKGGNLFSGSMKVELVDSVDRVTPIKQIIYNDNSNDMQVSIPRDTPLGKYAVRLTQKGYESDPFCYRIKVDVKPHAPLEIHMLQESIGYCSLNRPIILQRGRWLNMSASYFNGKAQFRLVPIEDSSKSYIAQALIFSYTSFEGEPSIYIPSDVPAGFYRVTLQSLKDGKVTAEGPPFWKVVQVK